ncbi:MAG: ABC transporter permease subunit, partial [Rhodoferax sp.]|nr:ABC transporter permease subunit [Rhodoferax sp.]
MTSNTQSYLWVILQGSLLTVGVSLGALVVSILLGLMGAAAKLSGRPVLTALGTFYTTIIRGIPDLVLMLLVFYGGTIGVNTLLEKLGSEATIDIEPFAA